MVKRLQPEAFFCVWFWGISLFVSCRAAKEASVFGAYVVKNSLQKKEFAC